MTEDIYIKSFANRITSLRMKKGVTARDMSLSMGFSHNYIQSIESEKNYPSMLNFFIICDYLGITPENFFDYDNDDAITDNELFSEIKKLDANSQEYFLRLIRDINNRPAK